MIAYLSGKVILEQPTHIILDVGGVGYRVQITTKIIDPKKCELFIHEHIREDCNDLYGFTAYEDLELFERLISVNGVGPKAGMAIMGSAQAEKIITAIIAEDINFFQAAPGIGKKVAAKIILDLKSKISGLEGSGVVGRLNESDDVIDALLSLGYKKAEIAKVLPKIPASITTSEEKVHWLLRNVK